MTHLASVLPSSPIWSEPNPTFGPLVLRGWEEIHNLPAPQDLQPKSSLFHETGGARNVYVLRSGLVKLRCTSWDGREMIAGIRSTGWLLGADSVLLSRPHFTSAITMTKCSVSVYSASEFLRAVGDDRSLSRLLRKVLSEEVQALMSAQMEIRSDSAERRLSRFPA